MSEKIRNKRLSLPSEEDLAIWRCFLETTEALRTELFNRLQTQSGLSAPDYSVLLALSEAEGNRIRSSELASLINWDRSRLSHHLRRMEKRGLVNRQECPVDGRGAEVQITAIGSKTFKQAVRPHLSDVQEIFIDALSNDQLTAAGEIAQALSGRLDKLRQ